MADYKITDDPTLTEGGGSTQGLTNILKRLFRADSDGCQSCQHIEYRTAHERGRPPRRRFAKATYYSAENYRRQCRSKIAPHVRPT